MKIIENKFIIRNKKAEHEVLSLWWLLILGLVGLTIVSAVIIFYSFKNDVRYEEAKILANRTAECILQQTNFDLNKFNLFPDCNLNEEVLDKSGLYFGNIIFYTKDAGGNLKLEKEISFGTKSFKELCDLQIDENGKLIGEKQEKLPQCYKQIILTIIPNSNLNYIIKITTASNQKAEEKA